MKNVLLSLITAITLAIGTTGCVSWRSNTDTVKPYIKPAVSLTVLTVLDNAVDEEDRLKRALLMYHAGGVIENLAAGDVPSADELKPALEEYLPEGVIWVDFIASLDDIYKTAYNRLGEDPQKVLEIVVEIAAGCREGAGKYLQDHGSDIGNVID